MRDTVAWFACLLLLAAPPGLARETRPVLALSDAELAARLGFLEERLDAGRPPALAWQWGWTGFYGAGLVLNGGYAAVAEDGDDRVRAAVDAVKSGVALAQTLRLVRDPLPANVGAAPMGAGVGGAIGAAAGGLMWWLLPDSGLPDFVMLTLAGVGVGGIVDWGLGASRANEPVPLFSPSFSVPVW